jgi:hypothetical protein
VETGGDRNTEAPGRADGAPAQGAFRGHIDGVRPVGAPAALEAKTGGQAKAQACIPGHRGPFDGEDIHPGVGERRGRRIDRPDQVDGMAATDHAAGE